MNTHVAPLSPQLPRTDVKVRASVCPHDCPSTCALEVEVGADGRIGRVRGARDHSYTAGVICAKVARYAERAHHPDRLTRPLVRTGPKGSGQFAPVSWDEALDRVADGLADAERRHGAEAVWPYYYAGTMGLVMRDGINRLTHAKKYSRFFSSICVNPAWSGYLAGAGRLSGADPREMAQSDLVTLWGTNAVSTQVNVMTHAVQARKARGAKIAVVDVYRTPTMEQADIPLLIRPGTDGALACAVMHVLFRDDLADRDYLARFARDADELEAHLSTRSPQWAAAITGLPAEEIEAYARLVGTVPRAYFRIGYGFTRSRNGAVAMHSVASIPVVSGAWQHVGGGAAHSLSGIYGWHKRMIEGLDLRDPRTRALDQSRIGPILVGEEDALAGGPPVHALFIQNTNPVAVAPEQDKVRAGFAREDLFVAVHEHFMTDTARMADVVLPATMFTEHDDLYQAGGHPHIQFGPKLVEPPGECRSNHDVVCALAARLGAAHPGFDMSAREIIDWTLRETRRGTLDELEAARFIDIAPPFEEAHFLTGFGHRDKRFHFAPDWSATGLPAPGLFGPWQEMPALPDHWAVIEEANADYPFRLVTAPARSFLNTTFTETATSAEREGPPALMIHPDDAAGLGLAAGDGARVESARGAVVLKVRLFDGLRRGVVVSEQIQPNRAHAGGRGINTLTGADPVAPVGGAAFHDNRVRIAKA
ncbi:molybdopterin-containing oxidoreductase family protein [Xanthobacter tagetidis]|uniref:Molybdopterin oxidoreductase family protein n=1 Tax=Xanthobacter tagetidis TaxID=60216 RepID=A0A3L7AHQ2_9HYPH|nr:molybdopterin oxidoreductase family protein [Xanthobacter tagetidis]MBB6306923.1 anaerobic selenocysteine-containing dehydrogenase [Xanthobacter tagetidis]RLP80013.1 molybdopterin oxidoreductase family protein [Xanthobacter tagetidis]